MSDSVWPHRRQPTRLPCPWYSPGKNTGVGCHFLLQCMKVKSENEVLSFIIMCVCMCVCVSLSVMSDSLWLFATPWTVHGIFQARILKWVAILFSRGSSRPRNRTWVSCIAGRFFTIWPTREVIRRIREVKNKNFELGWISVWNRAKTRDSVKYSCCLVVQTWLTVTPWTVAC